jgi:hypothetical protein
MTDAAAASVLSSGSGWRMEADADRRGRIVEQADEEAYGGVVDTIATGLSSAAGSATLGGTDVLISAAGGAERLRRMREQNDVADLVGNVGGAVGGMFLGNTPAGAIAKLGTKVGAKGTVGAVVKGGVVEGGAQGLGTGISQVSLQEGPLELEQAVSVLSSNMLYGAAIGGGANLAGKVLEKGIVRAKGALDEFAAARSAAPDVADDLAGLDVKTLATRELGEKARLVGEQDSIRQVLPDRIKAHQQLDQDTNAWLALSDADRESAKQLNTAKVTIQKQLGRPAGIAENPKPVLNALRDQETALQRQIDNIEGVTKKLNAQNQKLATELGEELATLPDNIANVTLSDSLAKRYSAWTNAKAPKGGITRAQAGEFLDALAAGKVAGESEAAFKRIPALLDSNRALQADILRATANKSELASPLLDQLKIAKEAASAGASAPKGMAEQLLTGSAFSAGMGAAAYGGEAIGLPPSMLAVLAPLVGAKASGMIGSKVFGRLGKATTEAAARTSKAVDAFLDVTRKVTPVVPVLASKVLGAVRYAPERDKRSEPAQGKPSLAASFKARSEEIRSQTAYAPDGSTVMRPQARQAMAAQLAPIRAANPLMADRMETLAARRLEFLASKLPRRADLGTLQTGPDRYQPSDLEMRTFARYAAGVEDPGGIEERLAAGQITPEDAQVMREVYPERLAEITRQIVEQLPTLRQSLPYPRRLALSILTGVAVDAAMHPRVLAVLQSQYASEEGSAGGTQAPRAQAQFGSVTSTDKATPAQERAS